MAFLINCPNCGERSAYEFKFHGEVKSPHRDGSEMKAWCDYLYFNNNLPGFQDELWFHVMGCGDWVQTRRNTATHQIIKE